VLEVVAMIGRRRVGDESGTAAVETALLFSVVLGPLLLGLLYYGFFFWKAQAVPTLDPNLDQSGFVGYICPADLLTRVKASTLIAVQNVDNGTGLPISLSDITTTLLTPVSSTTLGVDVAVSIRLHVTDKTLSFLPLPNGGNVVNDAVIRLQNVRIKTTGC
jgi:hypothetical protein